MKLKDAKVLRDAITAFDGKYCTVPLGHGPEGYFCRIFTCRFEDEGPCRPVDFHSEEEWLAWEARVAVDNEERAKEYERQRLRRMRSPIDILIDRACGLD